MTYCLKCNVNVCFSSKTNKRVQFSIQTSDYDTHVFGDIVISYSMGDEIRANMTFGTL